MLGKKTQKHILTVCSELHPTGKGLSYFYLYWKKSNFHSGPININLSLDKKICLLHSNYKPIDSSCPVHTCKVFHNIRKASHGFALSPLSSTRTDLSSVFSSGSLQGKCWHKHTHNFTCTHRRTYTSRCEKYEMIFCCKL